ncbi:MAG: delta-lactam-biosynthetic de-N-acetylase [Ruminococcaceae bacterium]|nr:delta-lactam-biosynthetic de-N-acetylase [Oscillospiraceae bacterium]
MYINIKLDKKRLIIIFISVLVLITSVLGFTLKSENVSENRNENENNIAVSGEITNWGLSFREKGKAPVGNVNNGELKKYGAAYLGNENENINEIYLTFDAGYEAGYTENILNVLKEENVKACFFIVGNYLETAPELVKRMAEEGHTVANHTYTHPDMSKITSESDFLNELSRVEEKYREITGMEMPKLYRPPQGKFSLENLKLAKENGYNTAFWSLAYVDWLKDDQPTHQEALSKLTERIHPGAIILLHSTSKTNSEILKELITKYKEMGYTFGTIDEVFK